MAVTINLLILIFVGFIVGGIPTGYLIGQWHGVDLRLSGSGNIGATNATRILGKKIGAITLALDALKGSIVVLMPLLWPLSEHTPYEIVAPIVGLMAIAGHCFSPFLRFRGGKGVATALGVFIIIAPIATAIATVVFVIMAKVTRVVAVGSLSSAAVFIALILGGVPHTYTPVVTAVAMLSALLVATRHSTNIRKLCSKPNHIVAPGLHHNHLPD